MAALTVEQQHDYVQTCAAGTEFVVNREQSPKAGFNRLALHYLGWASTSEEWCTHWEACFGEPYIWRGRAVNSATTHPTRSASLGSNSSSTSSDDASSGILISRSGSAVPALEDPLPRSNSSDHASSGILVSRSGSPVPPVQERRRPRPRPRSLAALQKLCADLKIAPIPTTKKACKQALVDFVVPHFDANYGTNYMDLAAWQRFCGDLGIDPIPGSITQCKKAINNVYINIYDFIAAQRSSMAASPPRFTSVRELAEYTVANDKVYPLALAKKEAFHRTLLQPIFRRGAWSDEVY